jgi:arylsulfatase A-like enzyme
VLLALLLSCWGTPAPKAPPDIVLVVIDTLRADHLGVYGHARPTSPTMDGLAQSGTWFHRAYAQSGWTLPSFTSLLTGTYPHQHRVGRAPFDGSAFGRLGPESTTLPEVLSAQGYVTAAWMNNTFLAPEFGLAQGFQSYDYRGSTNAVNRSGEETVDGALGWLTAQTQPAFALVHLMEPHMDYAPPESTRGRFTAERALHISVPYTLSEQIGGRGTDKVPSPEIQADIRRVYDEEILAADMAVGRLVDGLKAAGRWENTTLVITSDHGEEFWDHGGFEHGHTLLGELTRIPLIIAGRGPSKGRVDAVVEHVDLFQALVHLGGAASPAGTAGQDVLAIAQAGPGAPGRTALSENTLYGPPRLSMVDSTHRLELDLKKMEGRVYQVGPGGEERQVGGVAQQQAGQRLEAGIIGLRGDLLPVDAVSGPRVPSQEVFAELRALGYLDEAAPAPTATPDPPVPEPRETAPPP